MQPLDFRTRKKESTILKKEEEEKKPKENQLLWKAFCLSLSKTFAVSFLRADGIKEKLSATEHDPASESSQVDFTRLLPGFLLPAQQ